MATRRQERINHRIVQEVCAALRKVKDPRIGFVTVTGAEISPDLHNARVFLSVFGDEKKQVETLAAINHASGFLRHELGLNMPMKVTPRLQFELDLSVKIADEMNRLISEARATDPDLIPGDEGTGTPGEDGNVAPDIAANDTRKDDFPKDDDK